MMQSCRFRYAAGHIMAYIRRISPRKFYSHLQLCFHTIRAYQVLSQRRMHVNCLLLPSVFYFHLV